MEFNYSRQTNASPSTLRDGVGSQPHLYTPRTSVSRGLGTKTPRSKLKRRVGAYLSTELFNLSAICVSELCRFVFALVRSLNWALEYHTLILFWGPVT